MNKKPNYCWDACIFIAWLGDDRTAPLNDIAAVIDEIEQKKANLIVPVTAFMEVLEVHQSADQMDKFEQFLKRSNVYTVETSIPIGKKAGEIRNAGLKCRPKRNIHTPDATYIATAILHKADVLHTLEKPFLSLDGHPIVERLRITKPKPLSGQLIMFS
jgi:predicted nucleic acid-binding protein